VTLKGVHSRLIGTSPRSFFLGLVLIVVIIMSDYNCPFRSYFGVLCPGCGSVHAMSALIHGNLGLALSSNALLIASPFVAVGGEVLKTKSQKAILNLYLIGVFLIVVAFTISRNLPI
jgi:hypothetical protein